MIRKESLVKQNIALGVAYNVFHQPTDTPYLHEVTFSTRVYNFFETSLRPTILKYDSANFVQHCLN